MMIAALLLTTALTVSCGTEWSRQEASSGLVAFHPLVKILQGLHRDPLHGVDVSHRDGQQVQELWMQQPLDHFADSKTESESTNTTHWRMRYLLNDRYHRPGGPIFVLVGGEWEVNAAYLLTGHVHDVAREHGALLYYTEHRYYGRSWPTVNTTVADLRHLSAAQALADLAAFIRQQKAANAGLQRAPVVLAGGSYAGSLVVWFTKLYPQMAAAGWASSAPLLAKADFHEYLVGVGGAIKSVGGCRCFQRIRRGVRMMHRRLVEPSEAHTLLKSLRICPHFDPSDERDRAAFFNNINNYFAELVQSRSKSIRATCSHLLSLHPDDDLAAFTAFVREAFWPPDTEEGRFEWCLDVSYSGIARLFSESYDGWHSSTRLWFYQTCNEFGWYSTGNRTAKSNSEQRHPFGGHVQLSFFEQLCADVFGPTYSPAYISQRVAETNRVYGGLWGRDSRDVIMTHGQLDPWRGVGLQTGTNVVIIPGCSHAADFGSVNANDSISLNFAKIRVATFVRRHIWTAANNSLVSATG